MTRRIDPSLFINRLVVLQGQHRAYDERYHRGLNFIAGESNSVGKSTIANLLFHALGGEYTKWTPEAASCTDTILEVEINGAPITLRREVSSQTRRPMGVYWGDLDEAMAAGPQEWKRFPFARTEQLNSFSTVLFELLGLPVVESAMQSILTMHQLLRLIYVDQETSYYQLFRHENFDKPQVRGAIGALLCGYYSDRLVALETELRGVEEELKEVREQHKAIEQLLTSADQNVSALFVTQELKSKVNELAEAEASVQEALRKPQSRKEISSEYNKQLRDARGAAEQAVGAYVQLQQEQRALQFEIEDSTLFMESLDKTLESLQDSETIRDALGEVPFRSCPACFSPLSASTPQGICSLCKGERTSGHDQSQLLRMRHELRLQREESERLQEARQHRLAEIGRLLPSARRRANSARKRYDDLQESTDLAADAVIGPAYRKVGYLQGLIEDLERQLRLVQSMEALAERRAALAGHIEELRAPCLRLMLPPNGSGLGRSGLLHGLPGNYSAGMRRTHMGWLLRRHLPTPGSWR